MPILYTPITMNNVKEMTEHYSDMDEIDKDIQQIKQDTAINNIISEVKRTAMAFQSMGGTPFIDDILYTLVIALLKTQEISSLKMETN